MACVCAMPHKKCFSSSLMFIIFSKFDTIPILYKLTQNAWHKNSQGDKAGGFNGYLQQVWQVLNLMEVNYGSVYSKTAKRAVMQVFYCC